ncbi:MAG: secretin N-terminal domain-containing protein [Candidatus Omnitrophica bacterium]|jgi:type II secretory pathway component GspD/PulD (secretin)|nr:secretin N-terminal domain-containing protein [Candidatus Omnitrophota bacterium]
MRAWPCLVLCCLLAASGPGPRPARAEEGLPSPSLAEEAVEQSREYTDKIYLDLKGIDVKELFRILSQRSGITIITTPAVQGRVTVLIDNLSFENALDVIMTTQNLAYERNGNLMKVMTADEYEKAFGRKFWDRKETRAIKLSYAKPESAMGVINFLKSDLGQIVSEPATGTIVVTDTPQAISAIMEAINELDAPPGSLVYNVNYARMADIKNYLEGLITPELGKIIIDERSSKVIIYDLPRRLERIAELLQELDEQSRQVLITGEIVEVDISDNFQSGIEWEKIFRSANMDNLDLTSKFPVTPALTSYGKISMGTLSRDNYNVVMNMLSEYGNTRILNRPRIVAVNKEEAKILVGTREAYVTSTQSQSETTVVTSESINFIDVGVKLVVVPTIGVDGFITMRIKPEVSSVKEVLETTAGTRVPIVRTSESETVVKVKDGNTLIIAGLLSETDTDDATGLPGFAKTPIFGGLFATKTKEKQKTELVIFITPKIVTGAVNFSDEKTDIFDNKDGNEKG